MASTNYSPTQQLPSSVSSPIQSQIAAIQAGINSLKGSSTVPQSGGAVNSSGQIVGEGGKILGTANPLDVPGNAPTTSTSNKIDTSQPQPNSPQAQVNANTPDNAQAPDALVKQVQQTQAQINATAANKGLTLTPGQNGNYVATQNYAAQANAAHQLLNNSGVAAPSNAGAGAAGVSTALANVPQAQTNPVAQVQPVLASSPEFNQWVSDTAKLNDFNSQKTSALDFYNNLSTQYNIPGINQQLINIEGVINGTANDIRNEITASGGIATDSQVLAMSSARNQTLIQQANLLKDQESMAMDQIKTMTQLYGEDRTYAHQAITDQLNIDQQSLSLRQKIIDASQEGFKTLISSVGMSGLYNGLMNTDPSGYSLALAAQALGMTPTELYSAAQQDAQTRNLDVQSKQLGIESSALNIAKTRQDLAEGAGAAIPAKAGQAGYNDQGVKYTTKNAKAEIDSLIQTNGLTGSRQLLAPADYNRLKSIWVSNGLKDSDFDSIYGGMKDQKYIKQYN